MDKFSIRFALMLSFQNPSFYVLTLLSILARYYCFALNNSHQSANGVAVLRASKL